MLEVNLPAMILTVIVFLVLIYFLNKKLYKPLLNFMDTRNESIKKDEGFISNNSADIEANKQEMKNILDTARIEAAKIKKVAIEISKNKAEEEILIKKSQLEEKYTSFCAELSSTKKDLKEKLKNKIPEFKDEIMDSLAKI